jgi:hypothetical protein
MEKLLSKKFREQIGEATLNENPKLKALLECRNEMLVYLDKYPNASLLHSRQGRAWYLAEFITQKILEYAKLPEEQKEEKLREIILELNAHFLSVGKSGEIGGSLKRVLGSLLSGVPMEISRNDLENAVYVKYPRYVDSSGYNHQIKKLSALSIQETKFVQKKEIAKSIFEEIGKNINVSIKEMYANQPTIKSLRL